MANEKKFFVDNNAFVLYKRWKFILDSLSDPDVAKLFRSLYEFAFSGTVPEFNHESALYIAFLVMSNQIEFEGKKWERTCQARAEAGRKGGRPKKGIEEDPPQVDDEKAKKANGFFDKQSNQKEAKEPNYNYNYEYNYDLKGERNKRSLSPPPPPLDDEKMTYGEYMHVFLSREQYSKLANDFGLDKTTEYIQRVDEYCQQTGKLYKDYYLTIRKWIKSDEAEAKAKEQEKKAKAKAEGQNSSLPPPEELERIMAEAATKKYLVGAANTNKAAKEK